MTINLLQALPKTPLWERLAASGRLSFDPQRDSNVVFTRPYGEVLETWRAAIRHAYSPEAMFARYEWNLRQTYPNRLTPPLTRARLSRRNLRRGRRRCSRRSSIGSAFAATTGGLSGALPERRCAPGGSPS